MTFHDPSADLEPVVREESTYLTDSQAATLCTIFADGLKSGMGYTRIIDMLERQKFDDQVVQRLRAAILDDGNMLGEAFARYGILDATARKLVLVAEQQGALPATFEDLSQLYTERQERRKKFLLSFAEPCILVAVGLILARNIILSDFDAFLETMDAVEHLKPLLIQSGIEIGLFGSVIAFGAYVYTNLPVDMGLRSTIHRFWLRLPLGPLIKPSRLRSVELFCRYVEQSISSGLTVHRALALAAEASNNPRIESRIEIARQAIEQGHTLAKSLRESQALPDDAIDYIDVGEESGELEERLTELATDYKDKADEAFDNQRNVIVYLIRFLIIVFVIGSLLFGIIDMAIDTLDDADM